MRRFELYGMFWKNMVLDHLCFWGSLDDDKNDEEVRRLIHREIDGQ